MKTTQHTQEFKQEVYDYHIDLIKNDRGYGGSIMKRVRERFGLTGDQIMEIKREMETINQTTKTN